MSKRLKYAKLRLAKQIDAVDPPSIVVPVESTVCTDTVIDKTSKYFDKGEEHSCTNEETFIVIHSEDSGEDNTIVKQQGSRRRTQKPPAACPNDGPKFPKLKKKPCEGNELISNFLSTKSKETAEEDDGFEESKSRTGSQSKQTKIQRVSKQIAKDRKRNKKQSDIRKVFKKYKDEHAVLLELLKEHGASEQIDPEQLQIALAMSRSLVDQESGQKQTQTGEPLTIDSSVSNCSGSSEERRIVSIRTTLEQFGFRCKNSYTDYDLNVIFGSASAKNVKKIKHKRATNLHPRSKEELAAFIDEQAKELIHLKTIQNAKLQNFESIPSQLSNHFWIAQTELWSDQLMNKYYVPELFKARPAPVGCMLKDWTKIPGRESTPDRDKEAPSGEIFPRMNSPDLFNDSEVTNNAIECSSSEGYSLKENAAEHTEQKVAMENEQKVYSQDVLVTTYSNESGQDKLNTTTEVITYSDIERLEENYKKPSRETDENPMAHKSRKMQGELLVLQDNCVDVKDSIVTVSDVSQRPQPAFHRSSENIFDDTDPNPMVSFEVYSSEEEKISAASQVLVGMISANGELTAVVEQEHDIPGIIFGQNIASKSVADGKKSSAMEARFSFEKDYSFHRLAIKARLSEALEGKADAVAKVDLLESVSDYDKSIPNLAELNDTLQSGMQCNNLNNTQDDVQYLPGDEENNFVCCKSLQVAAESGMESVEDKMENTAKEDPDATIPYHVIEYNEQQNENIVPFKSKNRNSVQEEKSEMLNRCSNYNTNEPVVAETNCAESTFAYLDHLVKEFNLPPIKSQKNVHSYNANLHTSIETGVTSEPEVVFTKTKFCRDVSVITKPAYEVSDEMFNYLHDFEKPKLNNREMAAEKKLPPNPLIDNVLVDRIETTSSKVLSKIKSCTQNDSSRASLALRRTASEKWVHSSSTPNDKNEPNPSNDRRFEDRFTQLKTVATDLPQTEYVIHTSNVNQKPPAYDDMSTPEIERELFKYGLKTMQRGKAVRVLHYLFDEMHPYVTLVERHNIEMEIKKSFSKVNDTNEIQIPVAYTSAVLKIPRKCAFKLDVNSTHYLLPSKPRKKMAWCAVPLHISFFNLVAESESLQRQILRYEPINLEEIYELLKDAGLRYETNDLIAFFDKHCITFRTASSNGDRMVKAKSKNGNK